MRRYLTLRAQGILLGTIAFAVLLTIGSVLLVSTLESRLTDASDQLSRSRLDDLLALARTDDLPASLRNVGENGVAQVVGRAGPVRGGAPNSAGARGRASARPDERVRTATFRAPDDGETETYRFWYASGPSPEGRVTVYVGNSLEAVSEASAALRRALWLGVPVVVLLLGLVIWLLLDRAIGRLDRIRAEVDRISVENLHDRVAGDGVEDEVGRLAATMNAMLDRLEVAAQRQRDFVADVSHDLQSPLAAQRVALELALNRPQDIDLERLRAEVLGATADMEHLVGDLLVVALLDANAAPEPALIDLDTLALEEAARARTSHPGDIDTSSVSGAPAYANADDVRRIVRNLLDNAVAHARERVEVTVEQVPGEDGGWAEVLVADAGPGVPAEHRDRIFDRFYRAESARSTRAGSGLGLTIARGLAERNGGRLELVHSDRGATLRLRFPLPR